MLFAAVSGAAACCIPLNGDVSFISRPLQNKTYSLITLACYKYNYPASAVALNQHR